ncbi:hypothetical protein, partial [Pseudophaeobacter profundi]|uniref:hypothetical protein n=1 Tax=Pseudophaeobacter profundi TaxID=3034152 RepID=UPI00242BB3AC
MADQDHQLTELFRALGAQRPEQWASSQIHRYLFLKQAWAQVVDETDDSWIERIIESARRNPEGPFSG